MSGPPGGHGLPELMNIVRASLFGTREMRLCSLFGSSVLLGLLYDLVAAARFSIWLGLGESCAWFWPLMVTDTPP
jgi:hypothetical protein